MTHAIDEFTVLHLVKVKGFASADQVAFRIDGTESQGALVEPLLKAATESGHAKYREGRLTGYMLTPEGKERHTALRDAAITPDVKAALAAVYEGFLGPNREFKQLTTDWQLREPGSDTAPYLDRLAKIDETVAGLVERAAVVVPRYAAYLPRFERAVAKLEAGDATAFARPMTDSYHDIWMELHEDLISALGHQRTEADE